MTCLYCDRQTAERCGVCDWPICRYHRRLMGDNGGYKCRRSHR